MKINIMKLNIELARNCVTISELRNHGVAPQTLTRIRKGENVNPATLGKIAKALGVDPTEIMETE